MTKLTLGFTEKDGLPAIPFDGHLLVDGADMTSAEMVRWMIVDGFQSLLSFFEVLRSEKSKDSLEYSRKHHKGIAESALQSSRTITLFKVERLVDEDEVSERNAWVAEAISHGLEALEASDKKGVLRVIEMPLKLATHLAPEIIDRASSLGVRFVFEADLNEDARLYDSPAAKACGTRLAFNHSLREFTVHPRDGEPYTIELKVLARRSD